MPTNRHDFELHEIWRFDDGSYGYERFLASDVMYSSKTLPAFRLKFLLTSLHGKSEKQSTSKRLQLSTRLHGFS